MPKVELGICIELDNTLDAQLEHTQTLPNRKRIWSEEHASRIKVEAHKEGMNGLRAKLKKIVGQYEELKNQTLVLQQSSDDRRVEWEKNATLAKEISDLKESQKQQSGLTILWQDRALMTLRLEMQMQKERDDALKAQIGQ